MQHKNVQRTAFQECSGWSFINKENVWWAWGIEIITGFGATLCGIVPMFQ